MSGSVGYETHGNIGVITVNNPPVNALSQAVRQGLFDGLNQGLADDQVAALVLVGGGRTFIAGADIREFGKPLAAPDLNSVIRAYEDSPKPVICAIHGTALGGGLETAFGCHYRVAVAAGRVGLPEVKLGLIPGAGGTQRLPRVAGVPKALAMITSGDMVKAPDALEAGIIDAIVDDLVEGAVEFARKVVAEGRPLRRIRDSRGKLDEADGSEFDAARKLLERRARGFKAPQNAVAAVEAAYGTASFEDALKRERELFAELMADGQSKAQIYAFFGEREVAKIPDIPKDTPVVKPERAAVLGCGTMGGGIAMNFANAGIPVTILESDGQALERGMGIIAKNYASTVAKGRLSQSAMDRRLGLIRPTTSYDDIADADVVIEAVFEEMAIKQQVFAKLDQVCKPGAMLFTNTSTLDIDQIAAATGRPEFVAGTHFFSPANVMRLLEVVRGGASSKEAIATAMTLGRTLNKISVLAGNCDGFIGNRMLDKYINQAQFLVEEGAWPWDVDRVLYDYGLAMGPFTMGDMAGLDVGYRIRQRRLQDWPQGKRYCSLPDKVHDLGRHGQKTGAGWYRYEPGDRTPIPDPEIEALIERHRVEAGVKVRDISDQEILDRCLYALVNEGAKILAEGIALRPIDIDIIYLTGYGFPRYRGGPMFHADQVGLDQVHATISDYAERFGDEWQPADLIARLAAEGKGFRDL